MSAKHTKVDHILTVPLAPARMRLLGLLWLRLKPAPVSPQMTQNLTGAAPTFKGLQRGKSKYTNK